MKTIFSSSSTSAIIILYFASLVESRNGQPDTDTLLTKFAGSPPYIMSDKIPTSLRMSEKVKDELGKAASLFSGPVEVVSEDERFRWLESPVWNDEGNYLLFSDVKGPRNDDDDDIACGTLYKYDDTSDTLTQLLKCSGIVGPPGQDTNSDGLPNNIERMLEAGSNGLFWESEEDGVLLMQQHGWKRMVRLNVNDINEEDGSIDQDLVDVVADSYNGNLLNSPNDLVIGKDGYIYFTDPPFGLQYNDVDDPVNYAFDELVTQDVPAVYRIDGDSNEIERIIEYPTAQDTGNPNGVARNDENGDLAVCITDFNNPRTHIYSPNDDGTFNNEPSTVLYHDEYRIEGANEDMVALVDGLTYDADMQVLFISAPGGISIYEAFDDYELLGFIRIDDLCANNVVGGGYLWMTCNQRLLRIPLATDSTGGESVGMFDTNAASISLFSTSIVVLVLALPVLYMM